MAGVSTYGRSRQSIADIEQELYDIFNDHPQSHINDQGEPVIPGNSLVDVLRAFSQHHESRELMDREEEEMLGQLIESNPGLEVTPQVLLQFIAMRTTSSPNESPEESPQIEEDFDSYDRGRASDPEDRGIGMYSRSSSRDSMGTAYHGGSRPPSRGPPVPPKTPSRDNPFDTSRRQRSQPLSSGVAAPSSWARRPPPSRRRSDAGNHSRTMSDSESSAPPSAFGRTTPGRSRVPSNPTSPARSTAPSPTSYRDGGSYSRPHSRSQSLPQGHYAFTDSALDDYPQRDSPDEDLELDHGDDYTARVSSGLMSPPPSDRSADSSFDEDQFIDRISSLPMPRAGSDSDSDSDRDEDSVLGLVMDRSVASSTVSMDVQERIDALQRVNTDLSRKLMDAERTLQNRLAEHEQELEEMQSRLEEARSELSATKREEKELRSKERQNSTQIMALESEIAKLQKSLDTARISYQSLQKQYQEQCSESERYRNALRRRDEEIKDYQDAAAIQAIEGGKWQREQNNYDERISILEADLATALQAQGQLDEQKQENMMLKETIDRMRYDMDEMRNSAASSAQFQGSGGASGANTMSKSLGAELLSKLQQEGEWKVETEEEPAEEETSVSSDSTQVEEDEETESEDVIQTIITRTKRRVASRAKTIETVKVDEVKEYSDSAIQYDPTMFLATTTTQTDPELKIITASLSIQTDEKLLSTMEIQTEPEPEPEHAPVVENTSVEIQTEEPEPEPSTSSAHLMVEEEDDALASSSSTLLPPTPKAQQEELHDGDLPPAYNQVADGDREELAMRVANETIKQWHKGLTLPIEPVIGGISPEVVEDWKALKEELGVECTAIDRLIEESSRDGPSKKEGRSSRRKSGRFYNIYNTYVYGASGESEGSSLIATSGQMLLCVGASALVAFLVGQSMAPSQYGIPGGPTYYDRAAWSSFNGMGAAGEGFAGDTSRAAVLGFLGRLGGEAARQLRGWPT